ncbi:MAG: hypothetical protein ACLGQX_14360 [Acidobacteriota bacterium]
MDRRTFSKLAGFTALAALAESDNASVAQDAAAGGEVVLEDAEVILAFDPASGALTRMQRKSTMWSIERRPALGVSFRMMVPLPDRSDNLILGKKQRARNIRKIAHNQVQIQWTDLLSEHAGVLPITFTATVTLQSGELVFDGVIDNQSDLSVDTIEYPYFGDLTPPTPNTPMTAKHLVLGALPSEEIYPNFSNNLGYWGDRYPTKIINANAFMSQFCLIQSPEQGVYVVMKDPEIRYFLQFIFSQLPGVVDVNTNAVPRAEDISGIPVHLEFRPCHFVFAHPKSSFHLAPIVVRPYSGDWHAGLDIYKQWRATWFGKPHIPDWVKEVHSWQQLRVDGSEQDYLVPYSDLVQYGKECAENGVRAIQVVGWAYGGQDGGDPDLSTDPGLGDWEQLHDAIAKIQAMGVKIILFGKPIFAAISRTWYKEVLYKYECTDPYGDKYESGGYSYTTPVQLAGINNRRRAIMDVCCQEYRDIATHEFEKTIKLGAAGWLFDEVMQHNGVIYNFSADHGYNPPGYLFNADIPLARQFRQAAVNTDPKYFLPGGATNGEDFLFSGEGPGDWLMPYYVLGYYRIDWGTVHALRYIDPQAPLMAAVRGFNARDEINLCLLYRYIMEYEPYNFKGHITDFPLTLEYGKKVDALRKRYQAWVWDAEFRDNLGADVSADGKVRFTVFRCSDGKRAVVVASLEQTRSVTARVDLPNAGKLVFATPEEPDAKSFTGSLRIPPRSAAVMMES